jgi:dipeptidyl aminopeptidase/acylaminoacyl peptidase
VALDERLRRELDRAGRPADPSGVYEKLIRRRERRRLVRRVEAGALAVVVVLGSIGGIYALTRIFDGSNAPEIGTPSGANSRIVFSIPLEGEGVALMSVLPDGTGLHRLTQEGTAVYRSPDISPDGSTVVAVQDLGGEGLGGDVLVTVPIEGGSPTRLTREPGIVFDPAWSPDGERVAFAGSAGINVLDVATGEARLIPGTDNMLYGGPSWSPDGRTIAFEGAVPDPANPSSFPWDIYSVRLDGSRLTNLTRTLGEGETAPAWSWTSDRIAFIRGRGPAGQGLYTIAPEGTDEALVFDALPDLDHPAWSPDGTLIAFSADTGQVYTIPADGGEPSAVAGAMGQPAWQTITDPPDTTLVDPTPSPGTDTPVRDLGLGFPICNVSTIEDEFAAPSENSTVFVATRTDDTGGGCPQPDQAFNLIALDTDRDRKADTSFGPIECELECRAFSAPDLDGDGTAELMVVQSGGAVVGMRLYDIESINGDVAIVPVSVAEPGDPDGLLEPGQQASFLFGGDAFELYAVRCGSWAEGVPALVVTLAESLPHDSLDAEWHAHEVTLVLQDDGLLHVVSVRDFTEPVTDDPGGPSFRSGKQLCGSNLGPVVPTR